MRVIKNHPKGQVISGFYNELTTHSSLRNACANLAFISLIEPKCFKEAEKDEHWINATQEELNQFRRNEAQRLGPRTENNYV